MTRDNEPTSTSDVWLRAAFRLLSTVLLVLLAVGTTAILLLNALYDYNELRPRQVHIEPAWVLAPESHWNSWWASGSLGFVIGRPCAESPVASCIAA